MTVIESADMRQARQAANDRDVEFVKLGYAGASLDFRVQVMDRDTFRRCMEAIGSYNRFSGHDADEAIGRIFGQMSRVDVGREASVVLYLYVPFWTHQRMTGEAWERMGEPIPDWARNELADRIRALGRELHADEIHDQDFDGKPYCIRLWWD